MPASRFCVLLIILFSLSSAFAQKATKASSANQSSTQSNINELLEAEMKGMSEEEKAMVRKMMKTMMPEVPGQLVQPGVNHSFSDNRQLITLVNKKPLPVVAKLNQATIQSYSQNLYNRLMTKGDPVEMSLVKRLIASSANGTEIGNIAILCMLQGHPQAAMALSLQAIKLDAGNPNWQNNAASLLTQYGYPQHAIPILQMLNNQFPLNSTVINNLGQAWLMMGERDSAKRCIQKAGGLNPAHTEAIETQGVIEEVAGNTEKANRDYTTAIEAAINPFTEKLINNNNKGAGAISDLDFDKIKHRLTIYEYFPKDWIVIPMLSDEVAGYEDDSRIKNGYSKMFRELDATIERLKNAAETDLNSAADGNEDAFVQEMAAAMQKGVNMMSKQAVLIQKILQTHLAKWMEKYVHEHNTMLEMVNSNKKLMTAMADNDKCTDWDRRNNDFLAYANPLIREFHRSKLEEFRTWVNAYCTWTWFIAGNPKNVTTLQCISWTAAFQQLYKDAVEDQRVAFPSCVKYSGDGVLPVMAPRIPSFTCPVKLNLPLGLNWQQVANTTNNFNDNKYKIVHKPGVALPNASIAFGLDSKSVAEPGRSNSVKTFDGSLSVSIIDQELNPLINIPDDDLTPLPKLRDDPLSLPDLRKKNIADELLRKTLNADCDNLKSSKDILKSAIDKMLKGVKELEAYGNMIEQIKALESDISKQEISLGEKDLLRKQIRKMQEETMKLDKYEALQQSKESILTIVKEMEAMDGKKQMKDRFASIVEQINEMEAVPATVKAFSDKGFQPSLSTGLQVPGSFPQIVKLFD